MAVNNNIVTEWLKSLGLGQYAESFIDNGYDDLEICKQIGDPDLDAIGVNSVTHRQRLLNSVKYLREKGAASVYFSLGSSGDFVTPGTSSSTDDSPSPGPSTSSQGAEGGLEHMLRHELMQDGVRLSHQPYSMQDGTRGYLEGLAGCYADLLSARYKDVLMCLEKLRRRDVDAEVKRGVRFVPPSPGTPPGPQRAGHRGGEGTLPTSHSQPIYVPGKYSPSSCLSDKEEDEIYGFGYGVFGAHMARLQRGVSAVAPGQNVQHSVGTPLVQHPPAHNYQSCLSPRSAYFYEFPPSDCNREGGKKRTTLARLLRGLKTSHRKERHAGSAAAAATRTVQRDVERGRQIQVNGGPQHSFEETIHRLKVQEAIRKKERFQREHEEILRDIRHGLLQMSKDGIRSTLSDESCPYMYDTDLGLGGRGGHWYDEPPYESDPEDFLMGTSPGATANVQDGRVCFSMHPHGYDNNPYASFGPYTSGGGPGGAGVISLRSAGDISLPHRVPPRRGLILPQAPPHPPTIIPLTHARSRDRDRESGDYAGSASDLQSVTSRLSAISIDTSRSEVIPSSGSVAGYSGNGLDPGYRRYRHLPYRSEDGMSPSQSSDYEEDVGGCSQQVATVHVGSDSRTGAGSQRPARPLRPDASRKGSRQCISAGQDPLSERAFPCSASSVESLPSASGSSTQALVRMDSPHSSLSAEERPLSPPRRPLCRARALVDSVPTVYDKDMLKFKKGDVIEVISMNASGLWKGMHKNRVGHFKFMNVEVLPDRASRNIKCSRTSGNPAPNSVEELLHRLGLQEHTSVFLLNGYEDLELFKEIEATDLDYLGIVNADHRAKILTAVQLLHDMDCSEGDIAGSSSEGDDASRGHRRALYSPFGRRHFPRDSGCYDGTSLHIKTSPQIHRPPDESRTQNGDNFDNSNSLDSVVQQCSNEILKRVENAKMMAREDCIENCPPTYQANSRVQNERRIQVPRAAKKGLLGGGEDNRYNPEDIGRGGASLGRGACLSEKSSDSGVSSSSLSSAPTREVRPAL